MFLESEQKHIKYNVSFKNYIRCISG